MKRLSASTRCVILLFLVFGVFSIAYAQSIPSNVPRSQPELQGKTIRSIRIRLLDVFEGEDLGWFYQGVNSIKVNTRREVIARELRFEVGDEYDEFTVRETARQIRQLRFLRDAVIRGYPNGDQVDLVVTAKDTWTFIPQVGYSRTDGRENMSAGLAESNILGFGKRLEFLVRESDNRQSLETVWDDPRFLGSYTNFVAAYSDREDGERAQFAFDRPFLSFLDKYSWSVRGGSSDVVERLFEDGEEEYIFRRDAIDFESRFIVATGDPSVKRYRYALAFRVQDEEFTRATRQDFNDLELDPSEVSNASRRVPENQRFIGPELGVEYIEPKFVSMNYIDRFDRFEDYNLGSEFAISSFIAPDFLGSNADAAIFSVNRSKGKEFSPDSFLRWEFGASSRAESGHLENSLLRGEVKYFNVLGAVYLSDMFLGRHTLASQLFVDYGIDLDGDRQFLVGGDNASRGYKARAFQGDKRISLNFEDRVHLVDDLMRVVSVGLVGFADVGGATTDSFGELVTDRLYPSVGMGIRLGFTRSSGGGVVRLDIGLPLRDARDGSDAFTPRITFSGGQLFSARVRSEEVGAENANVSFGFDR